MVSLRRIVLTTGILVGIYFVAQPDVVRDFYHRIVKEDKKEEISKKESFLVPRYFKPDYVIYSNSGIWYPGLEMLESRLV